MPRKPRQEVPGGIFHLTTRGVRRQNIFIVRDDCEDYIRLVGQATQHYGWRCLSFCLMPNHVHLFVETPQPNLGQTMQWVHSRFAQRFNERHGHIGHVFERRYRSEEISDELHFINTAAYVAFNPPRAGLCRHPDDWEWSSHGMVVRGIKPTWLSHDLLLERLAVMTGRTDFFENLSPVT